MSYQALNSQQKTKYVIMTNFSIWKKTLFSLALILFFPICQSDESQQQSNPTLSNSIAIPEQPNSLSLLDAASEVSLELTGVLGTITYLGFESWDWGSSGFQVNHEDWFEMDTGSGGADKVGHLYTTYAIAEGFTHTLNNRTGNMEDSALWGSVFGWSLMLYVEWFDGYSGDHGFSNNDLLMNSVGAYYSYLQNTQPWLKDKIDLRVEYLPSQGMEGFHPMTDYTGYKYIAAIKPAGFEMFNDTFAKYFEFHIGYYTRGFKKNDAPYFDNRETTLYTGIGINLHELFFKQPQKNNPLKLKSTTSSFLHYYQIPGSYYENPVYSRTGPRR